MNRRSGYGGLGALIALAASLYSGGSGSSGGAVSPRQGGRLSRGPAPAIGNEVNARYSGGGASGGQKRRRKLARQTTKRSRGVRCQGRPAGLGRSHR